MSVEWSVIIWYFWKCLHILEQQFAVRIELLIQRCSREKTIQSQDKQHEQLNHCHKYVS